MRGQIVPMSCKITLRRKITAEISCVTEYDVLLNYRKKIHSANSAVQIYEGFARLRNHDMTSRNEILSRRFTI